MTTADMLRAEGLAKGETEGQAKTIARLLTLKFGTLPDNAQARLRAASPDQLATWTDQVLTATTLDEFFD